MVQGGGVPFANAGEAEVRVEWAMSCDYVILDNSNRFSLVGIFEGINLADVPGTHPQFFVVSMWSGPPQAPYSSETWIWGPDNEVLTRTPAFSSNFSSHGKGLIINRFLNVTFAQPGVYTVELLLDGRGVHQFPLIIQSHQQRQEAQAQPAP